MALGIDEQAIAESRCGLGKQVLIIDPAYIDYGKMIGIETVRRAKKAGEKFAEASQELGGATGDDGALDIKVEGQLLDKIRTQVEKEFLGEQRGHTR